MATHLMAATERWRMKGKEKMKERERKKVEGEGEGEGGREGEILSYLSILSEIETMFFWLVIKYNNSRVLR